uniref:Uncharacterized protein n=1 Tax=Cacopsylla melanoneura TaxID=428564 RepID=A0A8D9F9Z8_9HEMI
MRSIGRGEARGKRRRRSKGRKRGRGRRRRRIKRTLDQQEYLKSREEGIEKETFFSVLRLNSTRKRKSVTCLLETFEMQMLSKNPIPNSESNPDAGSDKN